MAANPPAPPPATLRNSPLAVTLRDLDVFGKIVAALMSAGVIYSIGAIVIIVRLARTDLPVEQGLEVIPNHILLVLGARELVLATILGVLVALLGRGPRWAYILVVVALVVVSPLTFGGLIWPAILVAYWILAETAPPSGVGWLPVAAVVLALCGIVARYTDPPYRFSGAQLYDASPPVDACNWHDAQGLTPSFCGVFLAETSDNFYLGRQDNRDTKHLDESEVLVIPRDSVTKVFLTPPPSLAPPRESAIARVVPGDVSCNPLECWVGDTNYGARLAG